MFQLQEMYPELAIPQIYEFGLEELWGSYNPYIEMEKFGDGHTLADINIDPINWDTVNSLPNLLGELNQIAFVLDTMHNHNIFHRDVKPTNILVRMGKNGHLEFRLADFGLGLYEDHTITSKKIMASYPFASKMVLCDTTGTEDLNETFANRRRNDIYAWKATIINFISDGSFAKYILGLSDLNPEITVENLKRSISLQDTNFPGLLDCLHESGFNPEIAIKLVQVFTKTHQNCNNALADFQSVFKSVA